MVAFFEGRLHTVGSMNKPKSLMPKTLEPKLNTPIAFVHAILLAYERRGMSPHAALTAAQIPDQILQRSTALITSGQFERLSEFAMKELDDEALGWFSRPLPWGSYGMLARASLTAPNLSIAINRWCRHHLIIAPEIVLKLVTSGRQAKIIIKDDRPDDGFREFCHVSILKNIIGFASWLIDSRVSITHAEFSFPAPQHANAYCALFSSPFNFSSPDTAITFDAGYLGQPVRRDETSIRKMLKIAIGLMVRPYRRDRLLVERALQCLRSSIPNIQSARTLAEQLNVSTRTLHRHLVDEGVTLQSLKDKVRKEAAIESLQRTNKPIKQISESSGFKNEKSFIRAFKEWTGTTPAAWRDVHKRK